MDLLRPTRFVSALAVLLLMALAAGCAEEPLPAPRWKTVMVEATAYTSRPEETDDTPYLAAWGYRLRPGMKTVAVSRDLLRMGLGRNATLRIEGLPGPYYVLDKMHRRWTRRIDVYFGNDLEAAREFGRKKVIISWKLPEDDED